jgi:16S rRNA (cytidine1402-2'-O)-methyltransferase
VTQGRIVIVGTPIGNLGDLSPRARDSLAGAGVIFCEDTRRARKLLSASGVPAPRLVAMHQHNEASASLQAVSLASKGATVAVITDAGMPGISDPGQRLVSLAAAEGVPVEVVPGPVAFVAALVGSGLPSDRFCFEGFLPRRGRERSVRLREIAAERRTTVLYEAPHRAAVTLADLSRACGPDRRASVGRELTKLHEEFWRGTLGEAVEWVASGEPRGEWVVVVEGAAAEPAGEDEILRALRERLAAGETRRAAVEAVSAQLSVPRRQVYALSITSRG